MLTKDKQTICSYGPIQRLYEAARQVVIDADTGDPSELMEAVAALERECVENDNDPDAIKAHDAAQNWLRHEDGDIDDIVYHNGTDGWWVMAWLFVSDEQVSGDNEDEE